MTKLTLEKVRAAFIKAHVTYSEATCERVYASLAEQLGQQAAAPGVRQFTEKQITEMWFNSENAADFTKMINAWLAVAPPPVPRQITLDEAAALALRAFDATANKAGYHLALQNEINAWLALSTPPVRGGK